MTRTRVAIVGGGVSGVYAAWLLEQRGCKDWVLFEAREALGGRILSVQATPQAKAESFGRLDLGPSWFWPGYQPQLDRLVQALGLACFEQHEIGDMMIERSRGEAPQRAQGYVNSPPSMRVAGGMGALVDALAQCLPAANVMTSQTVRRLRQAGAHIELDSDDAAGQSSTWHADHVLLALPPRLATTSLDFTPPLPPALAAQWQNTATWMAPQAKYFAVYEEPFWRAQGLSGEARSGMGPMGEIHDASLPGGHAALFGFLGVPVRVREGTTDALLREHCRAQLARLFGPQAASPMTEFLKDWALDPLTTTPADWVSSGHHPVAPPVAADSGPWAACLTGIGSEWSRQFSGYVAGAIEAASLGVRALQPDAGEAPQTATYCAADKPADL